MGRSKDLATGASYVDTSGDTMTGTLNTTGLNVTQTGSTTVKVGATGTSGDNDGTLIVNNGGSGDGMLRFDYETNTDRARIGVTNSGQDLKFFTAGNNERVKIDSSGRVTMPNQLHIFGTVKNTGGSGIANTFILSSNHPARGLSFSNSRIIVPIAGVYLITFHSISGNSAGGAREDTNVYVNGTAVTQSLSANNSIGYRKNGVSIAINLSANDYIQFDSDEWYSASNPAFDAWSTASVTLLG